MSIRNHDEKVGKACRFCGLQSDDVGNLAVDRRILESKNYFAIASIGGFLPGWTLICPKRHVLNLEDDFLSDEFQGFVSEVAGLVAEEFGSPALFEHGARFEGSTVGCGTNHAHLHLVPLGQSLNSIVRKFDPASEWIHCASSELKTVVNSGEYFFMSDSLSSFQNADSFVRIAESGQSQYFRRAIASHIGLADMANYRQFPFEEISSDTAYRLMKRHLSAVR